MWVTEVLIYEKAAKRQNFNLFFQVKRKIRETCGVHCSPHQRWSLNTKTKLPYNFISQQRWSTTYRKNWTGEYQFNKWIRNYYTQKFSGKNWRYNWSKDYLSSPFRYYKSRSVSWTLGWGENLTIHAKARSQEIIYFAAWTRWKCSTGS